MSSPSDFPDLGGGGKPPRPPKPPRTPNSGAGGPSMPNLPEVNKKLLATGVLLLTVVVVLIGAFISGKGGIIEVKDTEVAVIVNYLTGDEEIVDRPGYKIFLPFVAQAFVFDKSPNNFLMEGEQNRSANHVRKLTVRAKDGSNFWFDTLKIQYRIIPHKANVVLNDSGPGENFKQNWVKSYARSVLRDEFGRFSTEQIAGSGDGTNSEAEAETAEGVVVLGDGNRKAAADAAKDRLNEMLEPHGIYIMQILTPKPNFEPQYELAIADRKVADQEVETLKTQADRLVQARLRRLADVERDKATDFEVLLGQLEKDRIIAEKDAVRTTKSADAYRVRLVAEGQASEREAVQKARGLTALAEKEAEGLRAKVEALATRGDILVREALAKKFAMIQFEIVPYRRDPSPTRIEHLGAIPNGTSNGRNQ